MDEKSVKVPLNCREKVPLYIYSKIVHVFDWSRNLTYTISFASLSACRYLWDDEIVTYIEKSRAIWVRHNKMIQCSDRQK